MSVNFVASHSMVMITTSLCDFPGCCELDRCGYCNSGLVEEREYEAGINLSDVNMAKLIYLLDLQEFCNYEESCGAAGSIPAEAVATVRQRIFKVRNQPQARETATEAPSVTPGGWAGVHTETVDGVIQIHRMGPTVTHCGVTDEQIVMRLEAMDRVLAWAQERNNGAWWN